MSQSISKIEQRLYELEEKLAELESINNILIHQLQQGQKLRFAAEAFQGVTEANQYFHQLKKLLTEKLNIHEFGFFKYDERQDLLQLQYSFGVSQRGLKNFFYHVDEGAVGKAFVLKKMIYISDFSQYSELSYYNQRDGVKGAVVYLPLLSHFESPNSVLKLRRPLPRSFEEAELNVLMKLQRILGMGWDTVCHIQRLETGSFVDGESGLFNHRFFDHYFPIEFKRAQRYQQPFAVVRIDVHLGDKHQRALRRRLPEVLNEVIRFLEHHLRQGDVLIRYDVATLLILLPRSNKNKVHQFMKRLRELMHMEFLMDKQPQVASALHLQVAAVSFPEDTIEPDEMRHLINHPEKTTINF